MLKVFRVTTVLDFGGIEKRLVTTAQHGDDELEFVFVSLGKGGWAGEQIQRAGRRVVLLHARHRIPSAPLLLQLIRLFRHERPDVVHTSGAEANFHGILAARIAGVPVIVGEEVGFPEHGRLAKAVFRAVYSQCTHYIAISQAVKERLVKLRELSAGKISVIYNPVSVADALARPPVPGPGLKLLSVCRLEKVKNLEATLRVLSRVRDHFPDLTLTIVGDGAERSRLQVVVDELGLQSSVSFAGFQPDPRRFYAASDVFLLPSFSEGLSNSLLEAMSHRLLCVATKVGGPAELIENGVNGFLIDPQDPDTIEDALLRCLNISAEQRLAISTNAYNFVKERFSVPGYVGQLKKLYKGTEAQ